MGRNDVRRAILQAVMLGLLFFGGAIQSSALAIEGISDDAPMLLAMQLHDNGSLRPAIEQSLVELPGIPATGDEAEIVR